MDGFHVKSRSLLDKSADIIFSVATGALALSITFRSSLIPDQAQGLIYLKTSWVCFVVSILAYIGGLLGRSIIYSDLHEFPERGLTKKHIFILGTYYALFYFGFINGILTFTWFALKNTA